MQSPHRRTIIKYPIRVGSDVSSDQFQTVTGRQIPAVTAAEMREVDRVAVEEVGLQVLQMMENAGRALAWHVRDVGDGTVVVVAGNGGNGGGGLVCARHLANRDVTVEVILDRPAADLTGAAAHQFETLSAMDVPTHETVNDVLQSREPSVIVDALVGYGLEGALRTPASTLVDAITMAGRGETSVVSLDIPSGRNATTGNAFVPVVEPDRTVTLALPKTGLDRGVGRLFLADIGIPAVVYERGGITYDSPFEDGDWTELTPSESV